MLSGKLEFFYLAAILGCICTSMPRDAYASCSIGANGGPIVCNDRNTITPTLSNPEIVTPAIPSAARVESFTPATNAALPATNFSASNLGKLAPAAGATSCYPVVDQLVDICGFAISPQS